MDEIKNIGYIYKITNKINNKCYIGQTSRPVEDRWKEHKTIYKNPKKYGYNYPLYQAFRKYGLKNFIFEVIEECEIEKISEREIFWISYYNSFKKGYNQSLGGDGVNRLDLDEFKVLETYKKEKTILKVADIFNCSSKAIREILRKHNIHITTAGEHAKENAEEVYQLNDKKEIIAVYNSQIDAGRAMYDLGLVSTNRDLACKNIRRAILGEFKAYGYYWECATYSQYDKEKFKNKIKNNARKKSHKSILKKENISLAPKEKVKSSKKTCPICGKIIEKRNKYCIDCYNKKRREEALKAKEEKGINREFLKQEIRNKPFTTIAKEQGVTDKCISKWCKKFDLPYTKKEINTYSDEEWEKI